MKSTKPKLPVPLVNGALLTRREITLGLGHTALVEIRYDGPNQATPATGTEWPPETDWPAAILKLSLPATNMGGCSFGLHADLSAEINLLGESLRHHNWGYSHYWYESNLLKGVKHKTRRKAGTSLRQLAAEMLREVIAELRPVQAHLKARAARLAQREATLNAGLDAHPIKEPAPATA